MQYDFSFHHLEFDINLPVLVLSKSKAMLPSDCLVPLRPADAEAAAAPEVPREGLDELRVYLQAARHTEFAIDPEVTTVRSIHANNRSLFCALKGGGGVVP